MSDANLLRVSAIVEASPPTVVADPYLPLKITWQPAGVQDGPPPLYVRISGLAGGELELRVDRSTGALRSFAVLMLGAVMPDTPPALPLADDAGAGLILDPEVWQRDDPVLDVELLLRPYRLNRGLRIDVAGRPPVRVVACGPDVRFGLDADATIVAMAALADIDPTHYEA